MSLESHSPMSKTAKSPSRPPAARKLSMALKDDLRAKLLTARICVTHETGFTTWRYQTNNILTFKSQPGTKVGYSSEGFNYVARFAE
jgi:hypothetical protein